MPRRSACLDMLAALRVRDISGVWLVRDEGPIEKRLFGFSAFCPDQYLPRGMEWQRPNLPIRKKTTKKNNNIARLFCICRLGKHITTRPFHMHICIFLSAEQSQPSPVQ